MKKKVLCVCNGGNVRSTMLAEVLKGTFGCEAIAASTYWLSQDTMDMLALWADIIAPVEPFAADLPQPDLRLWMNSIIWKYPTKVRVAKVGPDKWGHDKHAELKAVCIAAAEELLKGLE